MFGPYCLQAAIAAVHAEAPSTKETDWTEIIGLYDVLSRLDPSPIVALNRAVAVAMRDGPQAGLVLVEGLLRDLSGYHLAHAAFADLHRRAGNRKEAVAAYKKALSLARQEPERRFLERRIAELSI
jgi:RNA polymerase sigma-70 factor (ECF subfamily)